ncbi:MAG: glycosyltransferase [Coleofasciculus sp. A1-SPW-01]|uniref:glycosyltransferase n=1 Tax=Coleofasciculus sp. A1-SPW-01 TaxID=3070819 RepID=UPI0032F94E35
MESNSHPFVSVIIPVYNDAERLKLCLDALENQTYTKTGYEVIVVDNASDEATDIKGVVAQFGQAIAAYESTPGSYAARNKGISLAKGEVIAFTDADCIPASDWIEKGVSNFLQDPNRGLVAGKIEIFFKDSNQITAIELYESITAFPQKELLEKYQYGAAANIFTSRYVLERVGLFDERFKSNGDVEWGRRVFSQGYKPIYADDTCVAHPARHSLRQLYKRTIRLAGGLYALQKKSQEKGLKWKVKFIIFLIKNLIPPIQFCGNTFLDKRLKRFDCKLKVCLVMFIVRYLSGFEILRLSMGGVAARE